MSDRFYVAVLQAHSVFFTRSSVTVGKKVAGHLFDVSPVVTHFSSFSQVLREISASSAANCFAALTSLCLEGQVPHTGFVAALTLQLPVLAKEVTL